MSEGQAYTGCPLCQEVAPVAGHEEAVAWRAAHDCPVTAKMRAAYEDLMDRKLDREELGPWRG